MTESQQQPGENPTSDELDVEGPNESAQSHNTELGEEGSEGDGSEQGPPPGSSS